MVYGGADGSFGHSRVNPPRSDDDGAWCLLPAGGRPAPHMTRDAIQSVARHLLTGVGSALVARGTLSESDATELAGILSVLIGIAWSLYDKRCLARERHLATSPVQPSAPPPPPSA